MAGIGKSTSGNILLFFEENPTITIGLGILLALLVGGKLLSKSTQTPATSGTTNASGLQGLDNGNIVYVPTQTAFTTENIGAQFSNDPNLQTITTGNITTNSPSSSTSSTTSTTSGTPSGGHRPPTGHPGPPPTHTPPPPVHRPPPTTGKYGLVWGAVHTVTTDDTNQGSNALNHIAAQSTAIMQNSQHAPKNARVTASDITAHNPGVHVPLRVGQRIILPSWERIG